MTLSHFNTYLSCLLLIILCNKLKSAQYKDDVGPDSGSTGISLAIVFDSTGSMGNDLKQVKLGSRRILRKHLKRGYKNLIKDFVLVQVHDPDVGPAKKTTSPKVFNRYLDSVYTQGGGDCPEMTISGIEMAIEEARPNSLIYVFTDSSAKDFKKTPKVLNLIQKKQSQVVFVLTGFCNSTEEAGFKVYREIATISSGQVYLIKKGDVKEFMKIVETAVESLKVHLLQYDSSSPGSKTYSFPVDSHLSQITIQITNYNASESVEVLLRNPQGRTMTEENGLERLLKDVKSVYFGSITRPLPGIWTLEVRTKSSSKLSVRITGISEVDMLPGFATVPVPDNYRTSRQPIKNVKNYLMANITGSFDPGRIEWFSIMSVNGSSIVRLPVNKTDNIPVYVSQYPFDQQQNNLFYVKISGKDARGYDMQRYSKIAILPRNPRPVLVSCPRNIKVKRGSSVDITCSVQSEVPFKVKWYRNNVEITDAYATQDKQFRVDSNVTYSIKAVNELSQGVYRSEMIPLAIKELQIIGDRKDEVVLTVLPPPPRVLVAKNASVEPLRDATLECNVFSTSKTIELKWFKDVPRFEIKDSRKFRIQKEQKSANAFRSTLTIISASESDKGRYICVAAHEGGKSEAPGFLQLHTLPVVIVDDKEIYFMENDDISASCRSDAIPSPKITWLLNGQVLKAEDPRITIISSGFESRIKISNPKPEESGELICKAENSAGSNEARIKTVYTMKPEIFSLDLASELPIEGKSQNIRCLARGIPPPEITWEFNGSPVTSDGNIVINQTLGTLDINRVEKYMRGQWSCIAKNKAGSSEKLFILKIGTSPEIQNFLNKVNANYGEKLSLKCEVIGQPPPKVTWFKGVREGDFIPIAFGNRYFLEPDNSLLINGVTMEDKTTYKCIAQNIHGKSEELVRVDLAGIIPPKIAFTQSKQISVEGTLKKVLTCLVIEAKPPAKMSWMKNGEEIQLSSRITVKDNSLIIKNVKSEDEGLYTCIAKNQVGTAKFDIELDVQTKPIIIGEPKMFIETSEGKKLVLECLTKGDPKPRIEWRKGGRPLTMQPGSTFVFSPDGSQLTIYSVVEEIAGTFTCTASNDHAAVVKEFKVTVKTPPIISKEGINDFEIGLKDSVELNCVIISGNPNPTIEWFKNGQPLAEIPGRVEVSGSRNILKLYGKNEEESGSYECKASNAIGEDSKFFQITVLVPPKASETKLIKIYTNENDKIILKCKIDGYPPPKKTWSWKSGVINLQNNPLGFSSDSSDKNDLIILRMKPELQGIYVCEGVNAGGRAKIMYDVIILESPKIVDFKERSVFFIGNTITLTCIASGNPQPTIKWLFKGKRIPKESPGYRMVGKNGETLIVDRAAASHGGQYSCVAENEGGVDKKNSIVTIFLTTNGGNNGETIKNYTINQIVDGGNITFTCVMNSTPPAEIKWFKDDIDLYQAMTKDRFHISMDGSTLTLFQVSSKDQGKYKCIAVNIPGQWSLNFTLEVLVSPVILGKHSSKKKILANEDTELLLRCWAEGNPPPKYYWYRDNSELISGGRIEIEDGGKTLKVNKLRQSDAASYRCRAKNEAGEDKRDFDVRVYKPPVIEGKSMRETPEFIRGKEANLWCNATGFPAPNIKWDYAMPRSNPPVILDNSTRLHFIATDLQHISRYTCLVSNTAGNARKVFDPKLIYPPKILNRDPDKQKWILKGGETRLTCISEASPQASIEWFKDGEMISYNPRINITNGGAQLIIFNAKEQDVGTYKCLVTNKLGQDKQSWTVDIMVPPSIRFSSLAGKHQIALGGNLYLFCVPDGSPKPTMNWIKDGMRIDSRKVSLSKDGYHLTINTTVETDVGRYQCIAENNHGKDERIFDVEITFGPTLDKDGKRYYKFERTVGSTLVLDCFVSGNPKPEIVWYKDGTPLQRIMAFRYRKIRDGRQLEIVQMQGEDAGRFSCVAKNTFGQMEIFMDVTVGAPPQIDRTRLRNEYVVKVGDEFILPCPSKGSPIPNIAFYKDGKELTVPNKLPGGVVDNSLDNKNQFSVSQDRQSLSVFSARTSDSGNYQCNSSNPIGFDLVEYVVRVRAPPQFDTSNMQTEAYWYINQTRSLECTLMGVADPPAKVTWERHGSPLVGGNNIQISPDNKRVTVENVQQYDAGEYRCYAQNEVGKISVTFQVLVYVKPRFYDNQILKVLEVVQNRTIQLSCEATGQPRPRFSWYRKDREIFSGQESYSNVAIIRGEQVLQITNIQEFDADTYSCTASNGGGTIEKKFQVIVMLPPRIMKRTLGPETHRIQENSPITLNCIVLNFNTTKPTMTWTKDNSPILLTDTDFYLSHDEAQKITVLNPTINEAGRYTCNAENIAGRDSHSYILTVTSPPKFPLDFNKFKETVTVQLGSSLNLQCPAEGAPQPTIVWFNREIPISPYDMINYVLRDNGKILTIPSVGKDAGIYKCLARNEAGSITKVYEVEIIMPPLVRLDKVEVKERAGATFSVLCTAEGFPKPTMTWTRDEKGLFRLGTKADPKTGMLTISDSTEEDSGRYTCTATNKVSTDSKSVDVLIISPPKIEIPTKPVQARIGEQAMLPCIVSGTPPIKVHWFTPTNVQISASILGEYRFLPNQGLIVESIRKEHAGAYRCVANNDAGYQEIRVKLDVLVPPKIYRPQETEVNGIMNSVLQIQCKVIEGIPSPKIVWERNGEVLSKYKNYYTTTEAGIFIFNSLKNEDEGSLSCIAKNQAGEDRLTFQINVKLLPKVTLPMSYTGDEGNSITMTCKVEGKPRPSVTWKKEGQPLPSVLGSRFRMNSDNEIYLYDLKPEDSGNYNCIGETPGVESSIASTYLAIFTRPKFTEKPKERNVVQEDRWVIFRCTANSHPKPEIKWMFNGRVIEGRTHYNGRGSIVLGPLKSDNSGEYRCIAKNRVGSEVARFTLEVIAKPKVTVYQSDEPINPQRPDTALICRTEGRIDSIVWLKNGIPVNNDHRLIISNNKLIIRNAEPKDTGTYECIASNAAGEAKGQVQLLIKSPPKITLHPLNSTVSLGDILILHCAADGYPVPHIEWYKDNRPVYLDYAHSLVRNGSLRIIGVQSKHDGAYFCKASNYQGEDAVSHVVYVRVQVPGGWSEWSSWSACSASCGNGLRHRQRQCNNPPPSHGAPGCIGVDREENQCSVRFCPVNGDWSDWSDWTRCSTTCGVGLRQRMRRCDNPPPSNDGKSCPGGAVEEQLCENLPQCPIDGQWSFWGPWSACSVSCGRGGTQRRERSCSSPPANHGGRDCLGKSVEVRSCSRGSCPIDGGWSQWSQWGFCSQSCGSGVKQRSRQCNSPRPEFGGASCHGNSFEITKCNETPCPIHGGWSNWGSWSECSVQCGNGLQKRERTCDNPRASSGGNWCRGSSTDIQRCNMFPCNNTTDGGESNIWSPWSKCSCTGDVMPTRNRYRLCNGVRCSDILTEKCLWLPKCKDNGGGGQYDSLGEIRGRLNNKDIGVILLNATWTSEGMKKTQFDINLTSINVSHKQCIKILSGLLTPLLWNYAYRVGRASNGQTLTEGNFQMQSLVEFADGRTVTVEHNFFTRENKPKLLTIVNGHCPVTLNNNDIKLSNYKELVIQLNPDLGKLNMDSARYFYLKNEIEPYQWSNNVTVPRKSQQHYMVQQLLVQDLKLYELGNNQLIVTVSSLIAEDDNSRNCPAGFQIVKNQKYCEDINECNQKGSCDQLCENLVPRYKCSCREGYRLGIDGKSCSDIDECNQLDRNGVRRGDSLCSKDGGLSECVNTIGGYQCLPKCNKGLRRSTQILFNGYLNCEDINECMETPNICDQHQCINSYGSYSCLCLHGFQRINNKCTDIDECSVPGLSKCARNQKCRNTPGGYICEDVCESGFKLSANGANCEDINECAILGMTNCSFGAKCTNLPGSYRCECEAGFQERTGACVDIDECRLSSSLCQYGCKNTYGSYECHCPSNMKQSDDRKGCIASETLCKKGFEWQANFGCVDVDECRNLSSSPCQFKCINTYGSYRCQCPKGYLLSPRDNKCLDIDECHSNKYICPDKKMCINSFGGYSCIEPRCENGYEYQSIHKACVKCKYLPQNPNKCIIEPDAPKIKIIVVPLSKSLTQPVEVRVVNTEKKKEANCDYIKRDSSPNLPVSYEVRNGSIILFPLWKDFDPKSYQAYLQLQIKQQNNHPFYYYFAVTCWSSPLKVKPIFQHSFYIYVTLSKYSF